MLKNLLEQLQEKFPALETPEEVEVGVYRLEIPPQNKIVVKDLDPGIYYYSQIGPFQAQKKEDLFISLMEANFLGQGTGGSVIGLDKEEKHFTLSCAIPQQLNFLMFKESLEDFVNYLSYWREELLRF